MNKFHVNVARSDQLKSAFVVYGGEVLDTMAIYTAGQSSACQAYCRRTCGSTGRNNPLRTSELH